jgi:hypothetical protein
MIYGLVLKNRRVSRSKAVKLDWILDSVVN